MNYLLAPGNLITVTGAVLTVIGTVAYLTGAANLSVPTLFYGFPIFIGGLALKTSELPPAKLINSQNALKAAKGEAPDELIKLVGDVTRWRYGQKAHLESSLEVLKLWDEDNPPQLKEIELLKSPDGYGARLKFELGGVPLGRWQEREDRLSRFFATGLKADLKILNSEEIDLTLLPINAENTSTSQHTDNESKQSQ
ncbi:DUF2854 domain-containing protein [Prochlorococcus sp. MIT 1300]|uniref:DUF2854 domain-containing protein n=1 Tax=Prochlorococcus sp. MIT 1300 TaxID=3096218 RepID=UPI002A74DDF9|nr:DUF2854 domain-containing protein [Prochlorococcus sp. MIT 1300]